MQLIIKYKHTVKEFKILSHNEIAEFIKELHAEHELNTKTNIVTFVCFKKNGLNFLYLKFYCSIFIVS